MTALRILHVLSHGEVTRGGAFQALWLARAQRETGHDVCVVVNAARDAKPHVSFEPFLAAGLAPEPFAMGKATELLRFRRFLRALRPDVIHAHRDTALLFTWFASTGMDLPAFVSQRGTTHAFTSPLVRMVHRSPRVHRIVAVAQAVKDALIDFGVDARKIEVVYGSFDVERFTPTAGDRERVRTELGLDAATALVVQVGHLNRKKAPRTFVRTIHALTKLEPDVVGVLVGKGKLRKRCEELAAELGLGDRLRLLGFRRDVQDLYAAADVVVNSSTDSEGLTGVLREALAMGRPVVATAVDGNPELVRPGVTGLLVPPRDPGAMADAIAQLVQDRDRAATMARAGRELVLSLMHPDVRVAHTEAVYRSVLDARAR
ncbi:MAG: glycosyltransferase family 4 protein [Planctomycetes bacterium]|nr:glycosyltransferase family 4 protein [Planctomycetota bacterium]